MNNRKTLVKVAAVLAACVLVAPVAARDAVTVGDFVVEFARARGFAPSSATEAKAALERAGIAIPGTDLDRVLTQGDVVAIGNAAGLALTSTTPEAVFTGDEVSAFLATFAPELTATEGDNSTDGAYNDNGADPRTKGKGKKKGLFRSPSGPGLQRRRVSPLL